MTVTDNANNETNEANTEVSTSPGKPSFVSRIKKRLREIFTMLTPPIKPEGDKKLYRYTGSIYTGAGIVKVGVDAHTAEEAKEQILLDYVRRVQVKVKLIG